MTAPVLRIPTGGDWAAIGVETTLAVTIIAVLLTPFFGRGRANTLAGGVRCSA
ncbi:MAG: hypothetical protein QM754_08810 [Tepidisphaeraceae bacterium]